MKREIKFRAWDKKNKEMAVSTSHLESWFDNAKYELMQYTGIKDKNGKEVYEGYIILFQDEPKYKSTWEVRWQSFGFRLVDGIGYRILESETYPKVSENGEVISNIYETNK